MKMMRLPMKGGVGGHKDESSKNTDLYTKQAMSQKVKALEVWAKKSVKGQELVQIL